MTAQTYDSRNMGPHIAVILAGGRSRRMQGRDKGGIELFGKRLVDHVIQRLQPQVASLILSAQHDFGTGLPHFPDLPNAPEGPVAGVWSAHKWLERHIPNADRFITTPVDGPFVPGDLTRRLCVGPASAIASDGEHDHPTFACWRLVDLAAAWPRLEGRAHVSLKALAEVCMARRVVWNDPKVFLNINSPADLEAARLLHKASDRARR